MYIQELSKFNCSGVFYVVNGSKKRVYVGFGVNMLNSITRLINDFRDNKAYAEMASDIEDLEMGVIETLEPTASLNSLRARMFLHVKNYEDAGYTMYRKYRGMSYKVKTMVDVLDRVLVMLTRPGCKPIVVGVFLNANNANMFIRQYYTGKDIVEPIYSKNEATVNWRLLNEKE